MPRASRRGESPRAAAQATWLDCSAAARIHEYRVLRGMRDADKALALLRRIGRIVRPIMLKHNWHLPLLIEMLPSNPSLLGLNHNRGKKISLRLRQTRDGDLFGEDMVMETMLHELVHNVRSPHDEIFDAKLKELTEEWYELRRKGRLEGEGFWTPGMRLGMGQVRDVDPRRAREMAARNAELRAQRGGGGRLGGAAASGSGAADRDLRHAAAEAAERRAREATARRQQALTQHGGCPSSKAAHADAAAEQEIQQERETLNGVEVVSLLGEGSSSEDGDDDESMEITDVVKKAPPRAPLDATARRGEASRPAAAPHASAKRPAPAVASSSRPAPRPWTCQVCTFHNPATARFACDVCQQARPGAAAQVTHAPAAEAGWRCGRCAFAMRGEAAMFWMCSQCGAIRDK